MLILEGRGSTAGTVPLDLQAARGYFADVPAFLRKIELVDGIRALAARPGGYTRILRLGYRPTFFLNRNSAALEKLMTLDVEIGSHGYNHPFLYHIPPDRVADECIAMRKFLETKLGHPVVSYAYPNGYFTAYDLDGDYVLRGVQNAGYWSGRSTFTANEKRSIVVPVAPLPPSGKR